MTNEIHFLNMVPHSSGEAKQLMWSSYYSPQTKKRTQQREEEEVRKVRQTESLNMYMFEECIVFSKFLHLNLNKIFSGERSLPLPYTHVNTFTHTLVPGPNHFRQQKIKVVPMERKKKAFLSGGS